MSILNDFKLSDGTPLGEVEVGDPTIDHEIELLQCDAYEAQQKLARTVLRACIAQAGGDTEIACGLLAQLVSEDKEIALAVLQPLVIEEANEALTEEARNE